MRMNVPVENPVEPFVCFPQRGLVWLWIGRLGRLAVDTHDRFPLLFTKRHTGSWDRSFVDEFELSSFPQA